MFSILILCMALELKKPSAAPGPTQSWTTQDGLVWDDYLKRWRRPYPSGKPLYPLRPIGNAGLWCDGVPYGTGVGLIIQQWEREEWERVQVARELK